MTPLDITPIGPGERFDMDLLHEAASIARRGAYAQLTDLHLRHFATYDVPGAKALALKRETAFEEARALQITKADPPRTPRRRSPVTEDEVKALAESAGTVIREIVTELRADYDARLKALSDRVLELEAARATAAERAPV